MQNEITSEYPDLAINILSINQIGAENGVEVFNETHALPMVNDNATDEIWVQWDSQWRLLHSQQIKMNCWKCTTSRKQSQRSS